MNTHYTTALAAIGTHAFSGSNASLIKDRLSYIADIVDLDSLKTVMEIGSWDALDSMEFATLLPNAQVHIFEAAPDNIPICNANLNKLDTATRNRIKLWNMAGNDRTGLMEFNAVDLANSQTKYNMGVGSKYKLIEGMEGGFINEHWAQKTVKVWGYKLDDWRKVYSIPSIDAVWMDVQGAELDVLKGAAASLADTRVVMTEAGIVPYYEGQALKPEIDAFLADLGFWELTPAFQMAHELEANVVYLNSRFYPKPS